MTVAPDPTAPTTWVEYDVRGRVAEIVLNRPGASNQIDVAMARSLAEAFARAGADPAVDVVLLRGRGRRFCAGEDVLARARERADALAARRFAALGEARRLVRASWGRGLDGHLDDEAATIAAVAGSDEAGALIAGFLFGR